MGPRADMNHPISPPHPLLTRSPAHPPPPLGVGASGPDPPEHPAPGRPVLSRVLAFAGTPHLGLPEPPGESPRTCRRPALAPSSEPGAISRTFPSTPGGRPTPRLPNAAKRPSTPATTRVLAHPGHHPLHHLPPGKSPNRPLPRISPSCPPLFPYPGVPPPGAARDDPSTRRSAVKTSQPRSLTPPSTCWPATTTGTPSPPTTAPRQPTAPDAPARAPALGTARLPTPAYLAPAVLPFG